MQKEKDLYPKLYFHSVRFNFNYLIDILNSGYILSRDNVHHANSKESFSGNNYISLIKYQEGINEIYYQEDGVIKVCGFNVYVVNHAGLILHNINPLPTLFMSYNELYKTANDDSLIRFSELGDEFQIRDSISLDKMIALFYPITLMRQNDIEKYDEELKMLSKALKDNNYYMPIIDSTGYLIDNELDKFYKTLKKI